MHDGIYLVTSDYRSLMTCTLNTMITNLQYFVVRGGRGYLQQIWLSAATINEEWGILESPANDQSDLQRRRNSLSCGFSIDYIIMQCVSISQKCNHSMTVVPVYT